MLARLLDYDRASLRAVFEASLWLRVDLGGFVFLVRKHPLDRIRTY